MGIPCEVVTWGRFYGLCRRLGAIVRASGFRPDMIVAVGRGGWMPGRVLSDLLGLMDLTSFKVEHYRGARREPLARVRYPLAADVSGRRVLLVDDVSDTGDTYRVALEHLQERSAPAEVRTAALHHKVVSTYRPDFYATRVVRWRWVIYPWAVVEDLSGLVAAMEPRPDSVEAMAERLRAGHGIRASRQTLEDVVELLDRAMGSDTIERN
jgi:hypoxanthine phosphoribosyltransferase